VQAPPASSSSASIRARAHDATAAQALRPSVLQSEAKLRCSSTSVSASRPTASSRVLLPEPLPRAMRQPARRRLDSLAQHRPRRRVPHRELCCCFLLLWCMRMRACASPCPPPHRRRQTRRLYIDFRRPLHRQCSSKPQPCRASPRAPLPRLLCKFIGAFASATTSAPACLRVFTAVRAPDLLHGRFDFELEPNRARARSRCSPQPPLFHGAASMLPPTSSQVASSVSVNFVRSHERGRLRSSLQSKGASFVSS
jgi:hypothetical protein